MNNILKQLYPVFAITIVLTIIIGIIYPLAVISIANIIFKDQAQGSLIFKDGKVIGSRLIGHRFQAAEYFHSRPSAAGANGYDGTSSGGTNFGPTNKKLIDSVKSNAELLKAENSNVPIPVDLVTSSASGLDPHITPTAEFQIPRVATEQGIPQDEVRKIVEQYTEGRPLGILGEPRVNVLELNLALDGAYSHQN